MKTIDDDFAARLASGVTTTCLCWRLTRRDGHVLAITDHDRDVLSGGVLHSAGAAFSAGSFGHASEMMPAQADARGALSHDGIAEDDLAAGAWDGARVAVDRVDWTSPEDRVSVWSGQISEVRRGRAGFEAELVSLKAELERPVGRIYAKLCDAALGDARCGVPAGAAGGATCDQRFETCRDVFANMANFRGFPHLPGTDFLLAGPAATGNSGGRR